MTFFLILAGIIGYLLGSANSSLIVGKFYGIDVRQHGSGNAGATNTLRTMGKSAALLVGIGDVLKGVIACLIGYYLVGGGFVDNTGVMVGGIAAIIGHNWPVYFGFKGGKGVFTSLAVVLMMDWELGLMLLGVFIIVVAITRWVSLGSILGSALFPVFGVVFGRSIRFTVFALILALLIIFRHRSNIQRLLKGTESKFGAKKNV